MGFNYQRTVRFHETDAAGVVYFANVLTLCHEAYEASLAAAGLDLKHFFSGAWAPESAPLAVPVIHADIDFRRPLHCGDCLLIQVLPQSVSADTFEVVYRLWSVDQRLLTQALTRHICIDAISRQRQPLPTVLQHWLTTWTEAADALPDD
jgi:1,4-dihydroxy-2-naphthoyl-CoA hydrolase